MESEFDFATPFQTNTLEKSMNSLIFPGIGEIVLLIFFNKDDFGVK